MNLNVLGQGLNIVQIRTLEPKHPHYTKESLNSLHHPFLESLPSFQDLLYSLTVFYEEKSKINSTITRWKEVLHNSLHSLLNELIYTNDKTLQLKLLDKITKWYYSKISPSKSINFNTTRPNSIESHPTNTSFETSCRTTVNTPYARRKTSTPQPKNTQNLLRTTYQAFVYQQITQDAELETKVNAIFEAMNQRQMEKIKIGKYNESKL